MVASNNWVIVVGAGASQVPYVVLLKRWGYRVFATDQDPRAPGFAVADGCAVVSTHNVDGTWKAVRTHFPDLTCIVAVISPTTGEPLRTVHFLARRLGITAFTSAAVDRLLNKGYMREKLNETAEVPICYRLVTTVAGAMEAGQAIGFPLVVKPATKGMGGRGVTRCATLGAIEDAFLLASAWSGNMEVVCEEYVKGRELAISALLYEGDWRYFSADRPIMHENMATVPIGTVSGPGLVDAATVCHLREELLRGCSTLGLRRCPVNADVIVDERGAVRILEIELTLADGLLLAPVTSGYDLLAAELQVNLGGCPRLAGQKKTYAALRYLVTREPVRGEDLSKRLSRWEAGAVKVVLHSPRRQSGRWRGMDTFVGGYVVAEGMTGEEAALRAKEWAGKLCRVEEAR